MFNGKIYFLLVVSILTIACSPTGSDATRVELSDLVGMWNSSENHGANSDVIYTRITNDGGIIEYDFDGDEVDLGLNCYQIDSGSVKPLAAPLAANRFLVTADMHAGQQFEIEVELLDNGHALKIYFLDSENPAKAVKSQIWTREADASILDNEPSCRK